MKENRTVGKVLAGLLVVSTIAIGGLAPAQARDTGWDLKHSTATAGVSHQVFNRDTGWD
jgi:hypothetical protein